jgi:hypothetical protein
MYEMILQDDHYIVWLLTTILAAKVSVVRVTIRVAVLEPPQSYGAVRQQVVIEAVEHE